MTLSLFAGLLAAVDRGYSYRPYNVILVTVDTLRTDYLSCYNPNAAPTPSIDALAKKGVLFSNAFSLIPITMPSHTAILSSHPPDELQLFNNGDIYDGHWPLLPDLLEDHHYHTAGFVSLGVLESQFGLGNHFDRYEDNFDEFGRMYKVASEVNAVALPWIEREKTNHFFAWIHYSDPHEPYVTVDAPPDTEVVIRGVHFKKYCFRKKETVTLNFMAQPGENNLELFALAEDGHGKPLEVEAQRYLERKMFVAPTEGIELSYGPEWKDFELPSGIPGRYFDASGIIKVINNNLAPVSVTLRLSGGTRGQGIESIRRNYAAEVQYADKFIGQLWQKLVDLNLENKTIVLLTADHGEGLKTHEYINHINCLYNETIHVPFILYYPNLGYRGKLVNHLVNHLDIVPTILDLLHIQGSNLRGHSLKASVSFSPLDRLFSSKNESARTFSCTYAPQASVSSFSMIDGSLKLIYSPERATRPWEIYDLTQDPDEKHDIVKFDPDRANTPEIHTLRAILEDYRNRAEAAHKKHENPVPNEEDSDTLTALGY